jgi:hypothetical protein
MKQKIPDDVLDYFKRMGRKGGKLRAKKLSADERKRIAALGAAERERRKAASKLNK